MGRMMALATRYEVSTQVASSVVAERLPAIWGRLTLTTEVSSTSITALDSTAIATRFRRAIILGQIFILSEFGGACFSLPIIFLARCACAASPNNSALTLPLYGVSFGLLPRLKPEGSVNSTGNPTILETDLAGVPRYARGKVRDVYQVGSRLLIVATDRISAFDYILGTGIPDKGMVLTQLSIFWFDFLRDLTPNHFLTAQVEDYPDPLPQFRDQLEGRSMLVQRASMIEIECVARGYLSGSGWKEYRQQGTVCGIHLPAGLRESDKLPEPIFTPATKAQTGHDENVPFSRVCSLVGVDLAERLRDLTLALYPRAARYAETKGVIIADTKFEFGFVGQQLVLGDEVLTPDSSRFWPAGDYRPGGPQSSYDKQFVRDYLESIRWNKQPPAPGLPQEVAVKTRYRKSV